MTYDLRVWNWPRGTAVPRDLKGIDLLLHEVGAAAMDGDVHERVVSFAQQITRHFPAQAGSAGTDYAWIGDPVAEAKAAADSGLFGVSLNLPKDSMPLIECAVSAAHDHGLCLLDEQIGLMWLPDGRMVGMPSSDAIGSWAYASCRFHGAAAVPQSEAGVRKLVADKIHRRVSKLGFVRTQDAGSGTPRWSGERGCGRIELTPFARSEKEYLVVGRSAKQVHAGGSWDLFIRVYEPRCSAALSRLLNEKEAARPACDIRLANVMGADWGRIYSPATVSDIDRVLDAVLVPLLEKLVSLQALDEFVNERTVRAGSGVNGAGMPLLPPMREQPLEMLASLQPVVLAWLAGGDRFEAAAAAKRARMADPESFDRLMQQLQAESPRLG